VQTSTKPRYYPHVKQAPIRRAVSLFAGAGGLDLGVEAAGYSVVYAVENDAVAVETLNRNRPRWFPALDAVLPLDITKLDPQIVMDEIGPGEIDLLVGGPPCVAFSKSGFHLEYKREGRDPKANLLTYYFHFLDVMKPKAFLMENVFGLAYRNQSAPFFDQLRAGIVGLGYSLSFQVLNAADYGVPQNRQRLFLIGTRDGRELAHPIATHWGEHERRQPPPNVSRLRRHMTAGEALIGLETEPEPTEHVNGKYGHLLPDIPPGGNYLHFTEHEGHPAPLFKWRSRYWTFLLKLDPDRPASTIQGQPGPYVGPFHWENRRLRTPELLRLQGFPDDYVLAGTRRDVQLQVGNSVPPPLAERVATAIRVQVEDEADMTIVGAAVRQEALPLR
jgi:DNA (cytosine-5)-methyltransferase 1